MAVLASALATGFLKDNSRIKQDMVMGVVFSGMFGLGPCVKIRSEVHLDHLLFGDMLGVSGQDIALTGAIAALTAGIIGLKWKDLLLHAFDPAQARACGLPPDALRPARPDLADHRRRLAGGRHHPVGRHADRAGAPSPSWSAGTSAAC